MTRLALIVLAVVISAPPAAAAAIQFPITGRVTDRAGKPLAGVLVAASRERERVRHGTATDRTGRFTIQVADGAPYTVEIVDRLFEGQSASVQSGGAPITLRASRRATATAASADWLAALPAGRAKRWFILDCTGCHQFNETRALKDGAPRTSAQWRTDALRMLQQFGPRSGFPIIAGAWDSLALGDWLVRHNGGRPVRSMPVTSAEPYTITEYDLPGPDLPHDIAVDSSGRVLVTGMFTHRMLVLDPTTGATDPIAIPVPNANPRAVEVDGAGNWWVLLGGPGQVARYTPATQQWVFATIGVYGHSIGIDRQGGAWANYHFATDTVMLAAVTPRGNQLAVDAIRAPILKSDAIGPSPIPYELRIAPNGVIWVSLLHDNALVSYDPKTRQFERITLPGHDNGPRRFDVAADGTLWIPGYGSSILFRFDPARRRFDRFPLPHSSALPYVARVHPMTGQVWIGTAAPDVVYRFDPKRSTFSTFAVLTRGASMRHLTIDAKRGDIWLAYGASPAIHPTRVARLKIGL